jgi:hypothetical protein
MTDEHGNRIIAAIGIICLTIIICYCTKLHNVRVEKFINGGYSLTTLRGHSEPQWIKH